MNVRNARSALTRQLVPGVILATSALVAACSGAAAAPTVAPVTAAPPSPARPTSWADWIDHQGFGAQNGPNEVRRLTRYLTEHAGATTLFDLDDDIARVAGIVAWLDAHPATACWADYHDQVRAHLVTVRDGWTKARPDVEAGKLIPADVVASADKAANAANDLQTPSDCP